MQLVGENEGASRKMWCCYSDHCQEHSEAIVPDSDLPSMRSAERFVDHGHVIDKIHVAKTLLHSENWDLRTDGTSDDS